MYSFLMNKPECFMPLFLIDSHLFLKTFQSDRKTWKHAPEGTTYTEGNLNISLSKQYTSYHM